MHTSQILRIEHLRQPIASDIVNTFQSLLAQSETMKISTISFTLLSIVSAVAAAETSGVEDVPFYLKASETDPTGVIAVVYYGDMGDESKEIEVPCTMMSKTNSADKYVGPESMTCQCEAIRRGCGWGSSSSHTKVINNSKCQLHVPFQLERDTNGTILSVTFHKDNANSNDYDDIMVVPFYPQKDSEGNIIAVDVYTYNAAQQSSPASAAISLLLWFMIIVGSIFALLALVRIVRNGMRRSSPTANAVTNTTTTGINPMNIKNMADLETPQRRRDDDDDDTATDDSKSDN